MARAPNDPLPEKHSPGSFATTHWSVVLAVGRRADPAEADRALAALCETYWYPLYAYVRRRTGDRDAAQDIIQAFFTRLLEKGLLAHANPERGRFRAFLLTALKNFLTNEWHRGRARKRGGGRSPLALDFATGERRYSLEPSHDLTPERLYERQWALTLLDRVLALLRSEYAAVGKEHHFDRLKDFLAGAGERTGFGEVSQHLDMAEGAARVAAHRLRKRYRELLREELAQTVDDPGEVDEEIRRLFTALAS